MNVDSVGDNYFFGGVLVLVGGFAVAASGVPLAVPLKLFLLFGGLVLAPGLALAPLFLRSGQNEWPEWLATAFGIGLSIHAIAALLAHLTGFDFAFIGWLLPAIAVLGVSIQLAGRNKRAHLVPFELSALLPWLVTGFALAAATVWTALTLAPIEIIHDSLDHVATIGKMAESGVVFPLDAFYADAGVDGADPRKGLYHTLLAQIVRMSSLESIVVWQNMAAVLAPFLVLSAYCLGRFVGGSRSAGAVASVLMLIVYGGGLDGLALREAPYSTRMADGLSMLTIWAGLSALTDGRWRTAGLAVILAFAAITTHVFSAIYLALGAVALVVGILIAYRQMPISNYFKSRLACITRGAVIAVAVVATSGPYLYLRWSESYAPADPIHLEPQGLLYWFDPRFFTVEPWSIINWLGLPSVALVLTLPFLWSRREIGLGPVFVVSTTVLVMGIIFNPILLPLAHGMIGYLVLRLIWCVPLAVGLAAVLSLAARQILGKGEIKDRGRARTALLIAVLILIPSVIGTVRAVSHAMRMEPPATWIEQWEDLFTILDSESLGSQVILSDPATSYTIVAMTGHSVVSIMPQHASPNDPRGEERLVASRDVLSPFVGLDRTLQILQQEEVDLIVLNQRFDEPMVIGPWINQPKLHSQTLEKFRGNQDLFVEIWAQDSLYVFALNPDAEQASTAGTAIQLPFTSSLNPSSEYRFIDGPLVQLATDVQPGQVEPGELIDFQTYWKSRPEETVRPGAYWVSVHLDRNDLQKLKFYHPYIGKPYRKLLESLTGELWRVRSDHVPLDGYLSPDQWPSQLTFEDRYTLHVPSNLVPGTYNARLKITRRPHHPNFYLEDLFMDEDAASGPIVGSIVVEAAQ